jgi:hypothetical protein
VRQSPPPGQHQAGRLSTFCTQCTVQYRKTTIAVVRVGWVGGKSPAPGQHQAGRLTTFCTQWTVQYRKHPFIAVVSVGWVGGKLHAVLTELGRNPDKSLMSWPRCYSQSPLQLCLEISISSDSRNLLQFLQFSYCTLSRKT